ncbi:MAG: response regulator transcription factor [Rhodocyclaceae bacterium]|nr:response regulator transcription factor [Rhodocyclaceae bacterium]
MNILLIEDNRDLARNIYEFFQGKGHDMDMAWDGVSGLHLAVSNTYDVLILDWMLPGIDGLTVCRRLREVGNHIPILMLTARDSLNQKIEGLKAGADDYVVKPFAMREVEARLQALVRRSQVRAGDAVLQVGDLSFNANTLRVTRGKRVIELPPISLKLLEMLMRCSPRVVRREELEREIWGESAPDRDTLRAHIHFLRHAVELPTEKPLIKTYRGIGYQLCDD